MIHVEVPYFPPSVNHAYFDQVIMNSRKGKKFIVKRTLTAAGRKFKRELKTWLGKNRQDVLSFFNSPGGEYSILIVLYFEALYNAGWPKKAKARHKKIDASNYIKVLEDALAEAAGHNDSQHVCVSVSKAQVPEGREPYFRLWAWNSEEEDGPIDVFLYNQ